MSKYLIIFHVLFLASSIVSCTNNAYYRSEEKVFDSQQYYRDSYLCHLRERYPARTSWYITAFDGAIYYECMRGKGWPAVDEQGRKIDFPYCERWLCF